VLLSIIKILANTLSSGLKSWGLILDEVIAPLTTTLKKKNLGDTKTKEIKFVKYFEQTGTAIPRYIDGKKKTNATKK
jgi:hypothetical protein